MKKSIKKKYRIKKTIKNRTRKNRRSKSSRARGSSTIMEDCCIYGSKFNKKTALIPRECFMKYGKIRAHKVCPKCWWGEFAKEGASHKCPGCVKGLPLAEDLDAGTVIDLTID